PRAAPPGGPRASPTSRALRNEVGTRRSSGGQLFGSGHQVSEPSKQVPGVVGPRRGFGMVLHAERFGAGNREPFDGAVIEVEVGDHRPLALQALVVYREAVVLRGD